MNLIFYIFITPPHNPSFLFACVRHGNQRLTAIETPDITEKAAFQG